MLVFYDQWPAHRFSGGKFGFDTLLRRTNSEIKVKEEQSLPKLYKKKASLRRFQRQLSYTY